jgi:hypothetical protein
VAHSGLEPEANGLRIRRRVCSKGARDGGADAWSCSRRGSGHRGGHHGRLGEGLRNPRRKQSRPPAVLQAASAESHSIPRSGFVVASSANEAAAITRTAGNATVTGETLHSVVSLRNLSVTRVSQPRSLLHRVIVAAHSCATGQPWLLPRSHAMPTKSDARNEATRATRALRR